VDAHDQHIFVVRAVEYRDPPAPRRVRVNAPQEVMIAFLRRRLLKTLDVDTFGIHGADHVPACTVLAGAVDTLEDDEKTMATIGVELALQFRDA
jgi:hypothetical protein